MNMAAAKMIAVTLFAGLAAERLTAQSAAGARLEFEVASVKANKSSDPASNSTFPLGPGSVYISNGGRFSATGFPLATYIAFAYKLMGNQLQSLRLPDWVMTDRFD